MPKKNPHNDSSGSQNKVWIKSNNVKSIITESTIIPNFDLSLNINNVILI